MPICLECRQPSDGATVPGLDDMYARSPVEFRESDPSCITIGLVNNMPDGALRATEPQNVALLGAAAAGIVVRLRLYALPDVPRAEWGRAHVRRNYAPIDELWDSHVDGLIITGAEPQAELLSDEPYWDTLTHVLDWAEAHTFSTVCSCLASHAAVLHMDGIARRPLGDKRFGVFPCERVADHPLIAGAPPRIVMPHSRWNELPEAALTAGGYEVLTRSRQAGVDAFVKQRKSLFLFFQGHPEYEADTLLLEYRRDVKRFLVGERPTYPVMPHGYFDDATTAALTALAKRASADRQEELLAEFPDDARAAVADTWRPASVHVYRNWLLAMCAHKAAVLQRRDAVYGITSTAA